MASVASPDSSGRIINVLRAGVGAERGRGGGGVFGAVGERHGTGSSLPLPPLAEDPFWKLRG